MSIVKLWGLVFLLLFCLYSFDLFSLKSDGYLIVLEDDVCHVLCATYRLYGNETRQYQKHSNEEQGKVVFKTCFQGEDNSTIHTERHGESSDS